MRFVALVPALALILAAPALGQSRSDSYKFLDAVRKADGDTVVQMLDEPGQRIIDARDRVTGEGALHILAKDGNTRFMRYVLAKGANPNLADGDGNTAAILAVQNGHADQISALADYHADFNIGNRQGQTPLILAVLARRPDIMRVLLDNGADPDQTDSLQGMSAREYAARDTRSPALLKLIEEGDKTRKPKTSTIGPSL